MAHVHGAAASAASANKLLAHTAQAAQAAAKGVPHAVGTAPALLSSPKLAQNAAAASAAVAGAGASQSALRKLLRNPWVLFGLGLAAGYAIHKYRKEIIESTNRAAETGKDFVLQQKENLEDLVGGAAESAE